MSNPGAFMDDPGVTRDLIDRHIARLISTDAMANLGNWSGRFLAVVSQ